MYEVTVEGSFSAAHRHPGPAAEGAVHGHDFLVLCRVSGPDLVDDVVCDFHALEQELGRHLAEINYRDLDQHPELSRRPATPAALARWIYDRLVGWVTRQDGLRLTSVEVRDSERTGARYEA